MEIPAKGWKADEILETLEGYKSDDIDWRSGRTWAYVYDPGAAAEALMKEAFTSFMTENGLDPTAFPSTHRLETELLSMAISHLQGDEDAVGSFTSGGTESIICAVKACRDWARDHRPEITEPEIVLPVSAHASFHKAAHYLDVRTVLTPTDDTTFKAIPEAVDDAISPNTIMVVGSACQYAQGVVDPIAELGRIALDRDVWLHVDGCMGGFLLQFFRQLGRDVEPFDFTVPGVRSISMDFHKYAFAPKGASTVMYTSREYRHYQMYACASWTGYSVINPTVQSTKSGGPLAAAWATLHFIGQDGYTEIARKVADATDRICAGIAAIPDLRVLGKPDMNLASFTSDTVNIFHVIDEMNERGWYVQPQLAYANSPENCHLSINPGSVRWVDDLLGDLAECVEVARSLPSGEVAGQLGPALADLDASTLSPEAYQGMLTMAGIEGGKLPDRMAGINEILNTLPSSLTEQLLISYLNELY